MCLAFYQGVGYSSDFSENMWKMKRLLEQNPTVRLIAGTDDICAACPNNRGGVCEDQEKVIQYDTQVLRRCGLEPGTELPFLEFSRLVREKILLCGGREQICGDCEWTEFCHF